MVHREGRRHIGGESLDRFDRLCGAQVFKYDFKLRKFCGERFDALNECGFAVQAEFTGFFAVYAMYKPELLHHRDYGEDSFEIADAITPTSIMSFRSCSV